MAPDEAETREITVDQAVAVAVQLHSDGRSDDAEAICDGVLAASPDHADALHFRGLLYHHRGDSEQAVALLERSRERAPDNGHVHNNLGNLLFGQQRVVESVASYRRAIELLPDLKHAHLNLSIALRHLGRTDEALDQLHRTAVQFPHDLDTYKQISLLLRVSGRAALASDVYRKWLELEPDNEMVRHLLAACSGDGTPDRQSDSAVLETFARFAPQFDKVMARLEYRAPALIAAALNELLGPGAGDRDVLDAGCGTGLCAEHLRPYARRLVGVDLSPEMIELAGARGSYDERVLAELTGYLAEGEPARWDLIVSADTLVYFGDLAPVITAAARALRPGALLVFTVERVDDEAAPAGFRLEPHGRYSHAPSYLKERLASAALALARIDPVQLRYEGGVPVRGWLVAATKI